MIYSNTRNNFRSRPSVSFMYAAEAVVTSGLATQVGMRTAEINAAFVGLKSSLIERGVQYANNTVASRGGFMAENFVADSYNLDAVLKNIKTSPANVPEENGSASADVVFGDGEAGLKFYSNAESSAKAQLNPDYREQIRIVPADQLEDAKAAADGIAYQNELKGRTDIAQQQYEISDKISDRIVDRNGVESTPLTKQQNLDMSEAISRDAGGNITVDEAKIDQVLTDTGITERVYTTKLYNDITGLGLTAAIGLGMGFSLTLVSGLARVGLDREKIDELLFDSLSAGAESASVATISYAAGRGATHLMEIAGLNLMSTAGYMVNFVVSGILSTSIICVYRFTKLKLKGADTDEALRLVGQTAVFSAALLTVSMCAQGIWGGPAGIIVSTGAGLVFLIADTYRNIHSQKLEEKIREFYIDEYKNSIDNRKYLCFSKLGY